MTSSRQKDPAISPGTTRLRCSRARRRPSEPGAGSSWHPRAWRQGTAACDDRDDPGISPAAGAAMTAPLTAARRTGERQRLTAEAQALRVRFPPRTVPSRWKATCQDRETVLRSPARPSVRPG